MATADSGRTTCESGGSREELCTSPFRSDLNEDPLNISQEEAGQNVVEEQIDLHTKTYKVRTISTGQVARQGSQLINNDTTTRLPMPSLKHPATMEDLPDELLVNIFIRLLAKEIAQMRSVSKPWNALLSHSSFIKSHLHRSIQYNDQILLIFYHKLCKSHSKPFTAHPSRSPNLKLTEFNKLVPLNPRTGRTNNIRIIGAVNGLICSSYDDDSVIHIWNPSLSAILTLPKYPMTFDSSYEVHMRFGYDPKANDYIVVMIIRKTHVPTLGDGRLVVRREWLQTGVYSMRKGSWELINQRFPSHAKGIIDGGYVCLDGHDGLLHWVCYCYREKKLTQTIVAFDLGLLTFHEITLPDYTTDSTTDYKCFNVLGVLDRKLCVMSWVENDKWEVWVMEEYGVADSWVKRHVFSQFTRKTYSYGFTSDNKLLFEDNGYLVLYDLIANETKVFESFSCSKKSHLPRKVVEYVDSLVWVAPGKLEMVDGA